MKPIPVLLVCYNRIEYTKKSLESIIHETGGIDIDLCVWDNASTDGTVEWLKSMDWINLPGYHLKVDVVYNEKNQGLAKAMNWFFRKYRDAQYVVKVDNDTVLPTGWLKDLLKAMHGVSGVDGQDFLSGETKAVARKIGAISATCLRPSGPTFDQWVKESMVSEPFGEHHLHWNSYVLGTGVLINMDMIRERGLLFEHFPYGPDTPLSYDLVKQAWLPTRTCLISGWTAYTRIAADYDGWKFAFYSKVHANLLNLKAEHVLSNDYPEYDEELKDARDQGNKWWESVGGLPGVKKYVEEHGGLEKLSPAFNIDAANRSLERNFIMSKRRYLTDCDEHDKRTTQAWWEERVRREGVSRAIFLDQTQARTNEFTAIHERIIRSEIANWMDVLEVGCGWGRVSPLLAKCAKSYVGTDFVEALLEKARETLPKLDFRYADAGALPFPDETFDAVVGVTCVSSFDERFDDIMKEMLRVTRKNGFVLLLEEEWSRKQWKLEHK